MGFTINSVPKPAPTLTLIYRYSIYQLTEIGQYNLPDFPAHFLANINIPHL